MSCILAFIVCITSVVSLTAVSAVAAAEVVPVYLNGNPITYASNDAQPQIISDRTYVPIRATCDALGLTIEWNKKTETLTFTRGTTVIAHTMRSKIVYVNGEPTSYDTASINKNDRTLMPIRMLADSIGANVEWDNATRSVLITTSDNGDSNTETTTSSSSDTSDVAIEDISSSSSSVASGKSVTISVTANSSTEKVKLVNADDDKTLAEINEYSTNDDDTRLFEAKVSYTNDDSDDYKLEVEAFAGTATAYSDSDSKSVKITVKPADDSSDDDSSDEDSETTVKSFDSDHMVKLVYTSSVKKNGYVNFEATTDDEVKRIKVSSTVANDDVIVKEYDENDDGDRVFSGKIKLTKTGSQKIKLDCYTASGYEEIEESFKVNVGSSSSSDSSSGDSEIIDVEPVNDIYYISQSSPLYVTTSTDIDYIEVVDDSDDEVGKTSFTSSKTSTEKKWDVNVTVREAGRNSYTVNAYVDDEIVDSRTVTLNGKKFSKGDPIVLSMEQKSSTAKVGEECRFTAKVSGCVTRLQIRREGGSSILGEAESSSTSSSTKNMTVSFEIQSGEEYYTAYAYDSSDASSTYTFKLTGDTQDQIEITDIEMSDEKVYFGDPMEVTVYTTNSCEKIWIEDSRGTRCSRTYTSPNDENGSEYEWNMTFSCNEDTFKSSRSFTIIAQGEDKDDTDEKTITVYFKNTTD